MRRHRIHQLLFALLPLLAAGCGQAGGEQGAPMTAIIVDDVGHWHHFTAPPARIISLIPAVTELIQTLGATDRLVARTHFDRDSALARLPSVGPGLSPSIEWLVAFDPDLVIAWPDAPGRGLATQLLALQVPVYSARIETVDDIISTTRRIGAILGRSQAADSIADAILAGLDEVRTAVAGRERPSIFYVVGHEPPMTAASGTFLAELIELAGGRNLFADLDGWPLVSLEEALRRRPDLIILPQGEGNTTPERLAQRPGWREFDAVRDGRIHTVDAESMHRPGPRIAEAARRLAELIHPDAFTAPDSP